MIQFRDLVISILPSISYLLCSPSCYNLSLRVAVGVQLVLSLPAAAPNLIVKFKGATAVAAASRHRCSAAVLCQLNCKDDVQAFLMSTLTALHLFW